MKVRNIGATTLLICTVSVASCVSHSTYPEWASIRTDNTENCISALTGTYEDFGENWSDWKLCNKTPSGVAPSCSLSTLLLDRPRNALYPSRKRNNLSPIGTIVKISSVDTDSVEIYVSRSGSTDTSALLSLRSPELRCENGFLELRYSNEIEGPNDGLPAIAATNFSVKFAKADDGSLVSQTNQTVWGVAVIVPMVTNRKEWFRWIPIHSKSP